jgi:hypothetical protein
MLKTEEHVVVMMNIHASKSPMNFLCLKSLTTMIIVDRSSHIRRRFDTESAAVWHMLVQDRGSVKVLLHHLEHYVSSSHITHMCVHVYIYILKIVEAKNL